MQTDTSRMYADAAEVLTFFPESLDTSRALWFARDILDLETIRENVVCLSIGASFDDFPSCRDFFSQFPAVFIAVAEPEIAKVVSDAIRDSGATTAILLPKEGVFGNCKNVREVMEKKGDIAVSRLMMGAHEICPEGVLEISSIEMYDPLSIPAVLSGIKELDRCIGGFAESELTIWTGKSGSGKSTVLSQVLLDAINQHQKVCAYSGELNARSFKFWMMLQAAGSKNASPVYDPVTGKTLYAISNEAAQKINQWWAGRLFLYDNKVHNAGSEDSIISIFEYVVRRYGCSVFLVDNLMTARYNDSKDFYRAQSAFVGRLVEFAKKYEVHVHLVAHPRKTLEKAIENNDDVGGSGDVTNRADNVISVNRLDKKDAAEYGYSTILEVLKNRAYGETGKIGLIFDPVSRRLQKEGETKRYGWEKIG